MLGLSLLLVLRILQAVCGLTVLALSSSVAQWYDRETLTPSPGEFHYLVNASLFSCFSVVYLQFVPIQWPRFAHPYTSFLIEGANLILLGSGWIALIMFLADLKFCRGSVCNAARADVALCGISVGMWLFTTFLLGRQIIGGRTGGARRGRYAPPPEMSQA